MLSQIITMPTQREEQYKLLYQQVLYKSFNNQIQWEEKAREELTDWHIKTGVNPATQLTRAGKPASLKEDTEVEHALDAFYAEMIL